MIVAHITRQLQWGVGKIISTLCTHHKDFSPIVIVRESSQLDCWIKKLATIPFFIEKSDKGLIKRVSKVDIINLHCYDDDISLYETLMLAHKPIVITLHFAIAFPKVSCLIICPSKWVQSMQNPSNKCVAIPNAIDLEKYQPVMKRRRRKKVIIARVCRMNKCDEFFWPTMIDVLNERKTTELWIIGEYGFFTRRIKMLGFCEEISEVLSKVDIVVHTPVPKSGAMDLLPMEVMAMKIAAIFSSVECIKASIRKSSNVLYVEPGGSKALKNKLLRLIDDHNFRFKIAEKGFQIAIKKFDATRMVKQYEDAYQRIMRKYNQKN